jgi:ribose transport system permease protein
VSSFTETVERDGGLETLRRTIADRPELMLVVVLAALFVSRGAYSSGSFSLNQVSIDVLFAASLGLLAAGQTLVMLTGGIDLSVAQTATVAAYIMADRGSQGTVVSLLIGLGVGVGIGLANGIGVGVFGVQPLIMTLGVAAVMVGFLNVYAQKFTTGVPLVPHLIHALGSGRFFTYVPWDLVLWSAIAALIVLGLRYSGYGRMLYAVGDNAQAARLAGVRVWQVQVTVYTICGLLSALAGILLVGFTNAADTSLANDKLLPSVAAVVIGGTSIFGGSGGYTGTVLGALILTVLDSLLTLLSATPAVKQMIFGGIILGLAWLYTRAAGRDS